MRQSSGARGIRQQRGHWTWAAHAQELAARGRVAQGRWNELMLLPPQKTQKDITAVKIAAGESSSPNFRNPGKMMFVVHAIFLATGYFLIAWCSLVAKDEDAILDDYAEAHQKLSDLGVAPSASICVLEPLSNIQLLLHLPKIIRFSESCIYESKNKGGNCR